MNPLNSSEQIHGEYADCGNEKTPFGVSSSDKSLYLDYIIDSYKIKHHKPSISSNTAKKMLKRDLKAVIAKHTQEARIEGAEAVRDATFDDTQDNASWHREPFECLHRLIDETVATLKSNINKEN